MIKLRICQSEGCRHDENRMCRDSLTFGYGAETIDYPSALQQLLETDTKSENRSERRLHRGRSAVPLPLVVWTTRYSNHVVLMISAPMTRNRITGTKRICERIPELIVLPTSGIQLVYLLTSPSAIKKTTDQLRNPDEIIVRCKKESPKRKTADSSICTKQRRCAKLLLLRRRSFLGKVTPISPKSSQKTCNSPI